MALATDLISYWSLDGDATDSVGSNDGSVIGASLATGKNNQCYSFDGVDDQIDTNYTFPEDPITVSVWFKSNINSGNTPTRIVTKKYDGTCLPWAINVFQDGSNQISISAYDSGSGTKNKEIILSDTFTDITNWHHIVFTKDGNSFVGYLDGQQAASSTDMHDVTNNEDVLIGGYPTLGLYFNGKLDEVSIWSRVLSSTEASDLYNAGAGLFYNGTSFVAPTNIAPNAPSNPSPSDTSTGISTSPTLSVDVSDPDGDSMDVEFYVDGALEETVTGVADGGTATTSNLSLSGNTTYSWYAIADDGSSTTQSPTWEFTTSNTAPDAPSNPNPSDNATGVSTSPTLSVDVSDPDGDSMDVSFYDASDDSLIGTDTSVVDGGTASVTWPGLSNNTTYSWYAIANDGTDTTQSSTWSFTTVAAATKIGQIDFQTPTGVESINVYNTGDVTNNFLQIQTPSGLGAINVVDTASADTPIQIMTPSGVMGIKKAI